MQNSKNPLHDVEKGCRLATGSRGWAMRTANPACVLSYRAQARKELGKMLTWLQALLQDSCYQRTKVHTAMNGRLEKRKECSNTNPRQSRQQAKWHCDRRGRLSHKGSVWWGFTIEQAENLMTVHGDNGAHGVTTSSLSMDVEVVTHAMPCLASQSDAQITYVNILTDSMNLMTKKDSATGYPGWPTAMHSLRL